MTVEIPMLKVLGDTTLDEADTVMILVHDVPEIPHIWAKFISKFQEEAGGSVYFVAPKFERARLSARRRSTGTPSGFLPGLPR